jgi:hypothetical protein
LVENIRPITQSTAQLQELSMGILARLFGSKPHASTEDFHILKDTRGRPESVVIPMRHEDIVDSRDEINEHTLSLIFFLLEKNNVPIEPLSKFRIYEVGPRPRDGKFFTVIDFSEAATSLPGGGKLHFTRAAVELWKSDTRVRAAAESDRSPAVLRRLASSYLGVQSAPARG